MYLYIKYTQIKYWRHVCPDLGGPNRGPKKIQFFKIYIVNFTKKITNLKYEDKFGQKCTNSK